jgi:hypothetical protein
MPDSGQTGLSGRIPARIRPKLRITGRLAGILDGSGRSGRTPGIWPETGQDGRLQVNWPGSGENDRIPATLPEFVYAKYKKNIFILFCE